MIIGAHCVLSSTSPEVDVAFFRDVLKLPSVNDGGYVIFGLPPAEVSLHEGEKSGAQELFLMCDDVKAFVADMAKRNVRCAPVQDQGWGVLTQLTLPGGGKLSVYEPRHKRPGKPKGKTKK
jgi:hypothetical protein